MSRDGRHRPHSTESSNRTSQFPSVVKPQRGFIYQPSGCDAPPSCVATLGDRSIGSANPESGCITPSSGSSHAPPKNPNPPMSNSSSVQVSFNFVQVWGGDFNAKTPRTRRRKTGPGDFCNEDHEEGRPTTNESEQHKRRTIGTTQDTDPTGSPRCLRE